MKDPPPSVLSRSKSHRVPHSHLSRESFIAFRRSLQRPPRLERRTVRARGLDFAVYTTPEVAGRLPLLCVNGGLLYDHRLLWPALSPLARNRQLILFDQRGRGATQVPPAEPAARIEHDAADVAALRDALGFRQWDVLGHSWGGGIAMLGAERDRQGVHRLVLVNTVGPRSEWISSLHAAALERLPLVERSMLARLDPAALEAGDPRIHSAYARAIYPAWFADRELAAMFSPPRTTSVTGATVAAALRKERYDWTPLLRGVRAETLVVYGTSDLLPPKVPQDLVAAISGARLALIPNAGHMPFWEAPGPFFAAVESFLTADLPPTSPAHAAHEAK